MNKDSTILVTGAAGFIGFHLSKRLIDNKFHVVGFDNMNSYYDLKLKQSRLDILKTSGQRNGNESLFKFIHNDLENQAALNSVF